MKIPKIPVEKNVNTKYILYIIIYIIIYSIYFSNAFCFFEGDEKSKKITVIL